MALALALASIGAAQAQPPYRAGVPGGTQSWPATPDQVVRTGIDRLTGFVIGVPEVTPDNLAVFLAREIAPLFDFRYMARWAAGTYWRRLDEEQRALLGARLADMFLDALARHLGSYSEPLPYIEVFPARRAGDREARVLARVTGARGLRIRLEFRLYWDSRRWRVFDVAANGASAVAFYRRHFRELLRRKGPAALYP